MNNRPKNNNVNGLIGNALGPIVYRLKSGTGGQYVFLNPQTISNLLGVNVTRVNNNMKGKTNNNIFEKLNEIYGRRPVKNPFTRENIKKSNIMKMSGPSNPVNVSLTFNSTAAKRNANKMEKARKKQEQNTTRALGAEAIAMKRRELWMGRRDRVHQAMGIPRISINNLERENNLRETAASRKFNQNLNRMINSLPSNRNFSNYNFMNSTTRAPIVQRLSANYENYKRLNREFKKIPAIRVFDKRKSRQNLATLRTKIEGNVKSLIGTNANNISRLNNSSFKNKVYYTLKSNGIPMKSQASMIRYNRNQQSVYA